MGVALVGCPKLNCGQPTRDHTPPNSNWSASLDYQQGKTATYSETFITFALDIMRENRTIDQCAFILIYAEHL